MLFTTKTVGNSSKYGSRDEELRDSKVWGSRVEVDKCLARGFGV